MKKIIILFFLLVSTYAFSRELPKLPVKYTKNWVFSISNNLNTSSVVYACDIDSDNNFLGSQPVYNYIHRKSGRNPREVSFFENSMAFGIMSQEVVNDRTIELVLLKYPDLPIVVRKKIIYIKHILQ
jgi:hypothetical protein